MAAEKINRKMSLWTTLSTLVADTNPAGWFICLTVGGLLCLPVIFTLGEMDLSGG